MLDNLASCRAGVQGWSFCLGTKLFLIKYLSLALWTCTEYTSKVHFIPASTSTLKMRPREWSINISDNYNNQLISYNYTHAGPPVLQVSNRYHISLPKNTRELYPEPVRTWKLYFGMPYSSCFCLKEKPSVLLNRKHRFDWYVVSSYSYLLVIVKLICSRLSVQPPLVMRKSLPSFCVEVFIHEWILHLNLIAEMWLISVILYCWITSLIRRLFLEFLF